MDSQTSFSKALDAAMWKGSARADEFPHRCPLNPNGVDRKMCVELGGTNFERNRGACCGTNRAGVEFAPCNSSERRCIKCLETGRRGKNAGVVTDEARGLCDEHRGIAKPAAPAPRGHDIVPARIERKSVATHKGRAQQLTGSVLAGEIIPPGQTSQGEPRWKAIVLRVRKALAEAELIKAPPSDFMPMPGQPREYFDDAEMDALDESIKEIGQIQDGMCRPAAEGAPARFELLDGERRWRSVTRGKLPEYRAKLVRIDDEAAPYMLAAMSNFNRSEHTAIEKSKAIDKLRNGELAVPLAEVAKMFGITEQTARNLLSLQKLCPEVKNLLDPRLRKKEDMLPLAAGYELARMDNPVLYEWQKELARKVLNRQIALPQLRVEVDRHIGYSNQGTGERHQPARRWKFVEKRLTVMCSHMDETKQRIKTLIDEGTLPPKAKELYGADLNNILDYGEQCLRLLGLERRKD